MVFRPRARDGSRLETGALIGEYGHVPPSERCAECDGVRIQGEHCLAHLTPSEGRAEIERLRRGERLEARGVAITEELLAALLDDLASDETGSPVLPSVDFGEAQFSGDPFFAGARFAGDAFFGQATFTGDAFFGGARFSSEAFFGGAQFSGRADFGGAQFSGRADFGEARFCSSAGFNDAQFSSDAKFGAEFASDAHFHRAHFSADARFGSARFCRKADLSETQFSGNAGFHWAKFSRSADFRSALFSSNADFGGARFFRAAPFLGRPLGAAPFAGSADFRDAHFSGGADFRDAQFCGDAEFGTARFFGDADFRKAQFGGDARFGAARFDGPAEFGPIVVVGTFDCDSAAFADDLRVNMSASALSCCKTRFAGRTELSVRWAEVALDDAAFIGRSRLVGVGPSPDLGLDDSAVRAGRARPFYADRAGLVDQRLDPQEQPRLLSVRRADVENLALGNLDLRACRFFGALGLDELRVEADCEFAAPPGRWRTRRRTLAEEHDWRAGRHDPSSAPDTRPRSARPTDDERPLPAAQSSAWLPPECQPAAWLGQNNRTEVLDPPRIASLYRALRKALEDRKDEPGAGDFYYGEMEMRRQRPPRTPRPEWRFTRDRGERAILTLYWLVSGYGMRASRALAFLALTVATGAVLFAHGAFRGPRPTGGPVAFALESAISLLRAPNAALTTGGEFVQIALRLLGPLFLGLALLALRGRVKR
jgi:hypothetical protein